MQAHRSSTAAAAASRSWAASRSAGSASADRPAGKASTAARRSSGSSSDVLAPASRDAPPAARTADAT
eukprot:scaffold19405_cov51-Isochrysis_galbana.AAC.1